MPCVDPIQYALLRTIYSTYNILEQASVMTHTRQHVLPFSICLCPFHVSLLKEPQYLQLQPGAFSRSQNSLACIQYSMINFHKVKIEVDSYITKDIFDAVSSTRRTVHVNQHRNEVLRCRLLSKPKR